MGPTRSALLAVCLLAHAASADPAEDAYQEGLRLYDLREWEAAIAKFKETYKLRSDPASLFNIAQAYRLEGKCVDAVGVYRTYKRNFPDAKNIPTVDKHIATLEACAKAAEPAPIVAPPPAPVLAQPATVAPAHAPAAAVRTDPGSTERLVGLVVGGAGLVAGGLAVKFGLDARAASHDLSTATGTWSDADNQRIHDGHSAVTRSWIAGGLAIAAVGTGVTLYVLGSRITETQLAVGPGTVALLGRF